MIKSKYIILTLISVIFGDLISYITIGGTISIGNSTYITALINYCAIAVLIGITYKSRWNSDVPLSIKYLYIFWLILLIFNLFRSFYVAESYWDWKLLFLGAFFFTLIPLVFYIGKNLDYFKVIFNFVLKYLFAYGFLLIPLGQLANPELYSRLMIPISLFILFIPYVDKKRKILIILIMAISILLVPGFRSNILKSSFSLLVLTLFYFKPYFRQAIFHIIHILLFIVPVFLFILAVNNKFNIFEEMEKNEGATVTDAMGEVSLTQDTRTFLFIEVFGSMDNKYNWTFGKSAIGSYRSDWFYDDGGAIKGKRYGSEVGMLNILLKYGGLGILIISFLLFSVSWIAIKSSSNILSKMIGLFIAFRFLFSFIEEYTDYDLNFYFFWLAIGLVSSKKFRNMTDDELKKYFQ